jgi:PA domain
MTADHSTTLRRALVALFAGAAFAAQAATLNVINIDEPGVGFNEETPAVPVGGNPGTTLGEQRQNVFAFVAKFWGARLRSDVPVKILATFAPLDCDENSAVLGAAGAYNIFSDFPSAPKTGTWYPSALANKLAGIELAGDPDPFVSADIISFFNGDLGKPGCLSARPFYLGLDGNAGPNQIDLLTTVLHEFGHGLGFQTFTDGETGQQFPVTDDPASGQPSIWDHFLFDPRQRKHWVSMSDAERARSAITGRNLVWSGERVTRAAPRVLDRGTPELFVAGQGLNRFVPIGTADFGPPFDRHTFVSSPMSAVTLQTGAPGAGCTAFSAANTAAVRGKVAVIDRGGCAFTVKVKNAQLAGAKAVVIADNQPGSPPPNLAGADDSIVIPAVRVGLEDGAAIKAALAAAPSRLSPFAVLFSNPLKLAGADVLNRVYLYTPDPLQGGSSVSHYDVLAKPNLLMEPFLTDNQPIAVSAPQDLTLELLRDIGW